MAIPLKETEKMRIGYLKRKGVKISPIGEIYIEELKKYKENGTKLEQDKKDERLVVTA